MTNEAKPLTGRKVLAITVGAFGIIFAANMALVYSAIGSFPGLEVKNSYVASQSFNEEARAQEALGWTPSVSYADGQIQFALMTDTGGAFPPELTVEVGRLTHGREDQVLALTPVGDGYIADIDLTEGYWRIKVMATAEDGTAYNSRMELKVE